MILFKRDLTTLKAFITLWILCKVCRACNDRPTCKCALYSFHHKRLTWTTSRKLCQEDGGDLVSIETDKEWKYLTDFIQNLAGSQHAEYFIGLSNRSGSWCWLSNDRKVPGQEWRWHYGQPSGDGECVVMYKNYSLGNDTKDNRTKGYFNDLPCNSSGSEAINRGFICEKTADCSCENEDNKLSTPSLSADVDGDATSPSQKEHQSEDKFKFILAIVVGSLDAVLLIVTVILCRGIIRRNRLRNHPAGRHRNLVEK